MTGREFDKGSGYDTCTLALPPTANGVSHVPGLLRHYSLDPVHRAPHSSSLSDRETAPPGDSPRRGGHQQGPRLHRLQPGTAPRAQSGWALPAQLVRPAFRLGRGGVGD